MNVVCVLRHLRTETEEETLMQERCVRQWCVENGKTVLSRAKRRDKAAFYSPSEVWCFTSTILNEPRGKIIKGGLRRFSGTWNMLSRKDLNSVGLETIQVSRNSTTVITANGGSANKRGSNSGTSYNLDFFVTAQMLEDTPAVL